MKQPIKVLFAYPDDINGTDYHRLVAPTLEMLTRDEFQVERCIDILNLTQKELDSMDVLIVSRVLTRNPSQMARARSMMRHSPCKLIVDVDDYWELPLEHPLHQHWTTNKGDRMMKRTMAMADLIWTTTTRLKSEIDRVVNMPDNTHVRPNRISRRDNQWDSAYLKTHSPVLRIGVVALPNHWMNIVLLKDALRAMNADQSWWRLMVMGVSPMHHNHVKMLLGTNNIDFLPVEEPWSYARLYRFIDLLVCPLVRNHFNAMRSPIKAIECSVTRTAILAENYGPYQGAGQINEGGWIMLPQIARKMWEEGINIAHDINPNLYSDSVDSQRITDIINLVSHGSEKAA